MDANYVALGRSRRKVVNVWNLNPYRVDLFNVVLDRHFQDLNHRFTENNTELLLSITCLSPDDLISAFDKEKTDSVAYLYHIEFSAANIVLYSWF